MSRAAHGKSVRFVMKAGRRQTLPITSHHHIPIILTQHRPGPQLLTAALSTPTDEHLVFCQNWWYRECNTRQPPALIDVTRGTALHYHRRSKTSRWPARSPPTPTPSESVITGLAHLVVTSQTQSQRGSGKNTAASRAPHERKSACRRLPRIACRRWGTNGHGGSTSSPATKRWLHRGTRRDRSGPAPSCPDRNPRNSGAKGRRGRPGITKRPRISAAR